MKINRFFLFLIVLVLSACQSVPHQAPIESYQVKASKKPLPQHYTVRKGDTLYSISWRYGLDFKQLAKWNGITPPYTIYIGQKLYFKQRQLASRLSKRHSKKTVKPPTIKAKKQIKNSRIRWQWPVKGKVISRYAKNIASQKGIDITAPQGTPIAAAAAGKIVYSGNGLARYGNLIIIKHNDTYLSAYAHNKVLLVKEGEAVKAGQKIAELGRTGVKVDKLHFEIRQHGQPVDPIRFLPPQ